MMEKNVLNISETSPSRFSYSNWWFYRMLVNLSQHSYWRENEKNCSGGGVGDVWRAATVFFRQANLWVGLTWTSKWCDEWYDLLVCANVQWKKLCVGHECVHQSQSSALRGKTCNQGRMTGHTWVHATTMEHIAPNNMKESWLSGVGWANVLERF